MILILICPNCERQLVVTDDVKVFYCESCDKEYSMLQCIKRVELDRVYLSG